jgi:hypothetical protein
MTEHWFWFLLTIACLAWYSLITIYVAVRGTVDVKTMLARLSGEGKGQDGEGGAT